MAVLTDPRYQALASQLAGLIGGGANTARALLALMACEKRGEWPPQDNNPLNFHTGTAADAGVRGLPGGVGDGGAVAAMSSPQYAIQVTALILQRLGRYQGVLSAAARDDGPGVISAWGSSGWGTSAGCGFTNYQHATATPPPVDKPPAGTPPGNMGFYASGLYAKPGPPPSCPTPVASTSGTLAVVLGRDGILTLGNVPTVAAAVAAATATTPGWPAPAPPPLGPGGKGESASDVGAYLVDFVGQCYSRIPINVTDPTKTFQTTPRSPSPSDVASGWVGQLISGLVPILVNGAVLLLALVLAYRGLRDLVEPQ